MTIVRLKNACNLCRVSSRFITQTRLNYNAAAPAGEYTEEPEYPPILVTTPDAFRRRRKEEWHQKVTSLPTVEQKLMELNFPKYYGYWSCRLSDAHFQRNSLDFVKYATRTHLTKELPVDYYEDVREQASNVASTIQDEVEALIRLHFTTDLSNRHSKRKDALTESFLMGLHKIMNVALAPTVDHVKESLVDLQPRIEAFWLLGEIEADKLLKATRKGSSRTEHMENDRIDRPMQSIAHPLLGVRSDLGLPEVVERDHSLSTSGEVPIENMDPRSYGLKFKHKHARITTAFWPYKSKEHCRLWMHGKEALTRYTSRDGEHHYNKFLHQKMILSSFTQALAHATYLGFGPVTELTYPIVHQSVLSDGQKWNFSVYQLNTSVLHSEHAVENPFNNILWLNDEQLLFEAVDETGVKGFNKEVLDNLVAMYLKKGIERENPTPYLGPDKYLAHHPSEAEYRQDFQHFLQQYILSGRPNAKKMGEIYNWEWIYKVKFKTRPREPLKQFFQPHFAQKHPGCKTLDDLPPRYIPKAVRKEGMRKQKFKPKLNTEHLFKYD